MKTKIINIIYSFSLMLFVIAFNFQHNPPSGWYQQFMPDLNNRPLSDITFVDSLTGYAITGDNTVGDTNYILKTSNGGDNWSIIHSVYRDLNRVIFLDQNTGYVCGGLNTSGSYLVKTTDGGTNWTQINSPKALRIRDMSVLNEDTIWIADDFFSRNVYRTTNGGSNWELQYSTGNQITRVYFFNGELGFLNVTSGLWRTTNSGLNWTQVPGENGFRDMYFADSLTGWKCNVLMKKTTDGGLTWITQTLQSGGYIQTSGISSFSNINADTIWGVGGYVLFPNNQVRAIMHRTTNGGGNWLYQIPDTSVIVFPEYVEFDNSKTGWGYDVAPTGIHTKTGGDSIFLSIQQISSEIPSDFVLHQNYPNPFNPVTRIRFDIPVTGDVKFMVYDILGKQVELLVDEKLSTGSYEYTFNASRLSSGVYFYTLRTDKAVLTKKMLLTK
jgi:photosystem II stability/assembly factor-like uncharacterized protein